MVVRSGGNALKGQSDPGPPRIVKARPVTCSKLSLEPSLDLH